MLNKLYLLVRKIFIKKEEAGEYSSGGWPSLIRNKALKYCNNEINMIVEFGCGEGLFLEKLAKQNPDSAIVGLDGWKEIIEKAGQRLKQYRNVSLVNQSIFGNTLNSGEFGFCFCLNTIYNLKGIYEVESLFKEGHRLLTRNGSLIFDIRNASNLFVSLKYKFAKLYDSQIKVPLNSYSEKDIDDLLVKTGFKHFDKIHLGFPGNKYSPIILYKADKL